MNITQERLREIIAEEYLKEEGILQELTDEQKEEMLAWIRGQGPRPKWATGDLGTSAAAKRRQNQAVQAPNDSGADRSAETMPFPPRMMPDEEDEPEAAPLTGPNPIKAAIDGIYELVADMEPEDVKDIFQIVFQKLPGVELLSPGDEGYPEEKPPTEYVRGAMGRPTVGFKEIKQLILKVLTEGHYHDMGDGDEMYNALDPHGFDKMSDAELIDMMRKDGAEELVVTDGEGDLINRDEVIATLKDV
jgi:hypothetical protein